MSQFFMDAYVNMVGTAALNYYNVTEIDKCLTSNEEDEQ